MKAVLTYFRHYVALHCKNSKYTIYNIDYARDVFLCMRVEKRSLKNDEIKNVK